MQHLTRPHKMARRQLLTRRLVGVTFVAAVCLATVATATADPIAITAGTISAAAWGPSSASPTSFTGVPSFSFAGEVLASEGRVDPLSSCPPCFPGSTISVGGDLTGDAISGVGSFQGTPYHAGSMLDPAGFSLQFDGQAVVPRSGGVSAKVTVPFTMTGLFFTDDGANVHEITGHGLASVWFQADPMDQHSSAWTVDRVQYAFGPSAPVPEPATLGTLAFGLAALARTAHKRRSRRS